LRGPRGKEGSGEFEESFVRRTKGTIKIYQKEEKERPCGSEGEEERH